MDRSLDGSRPERSVWKQYRQTMDTSSFINSACSRQTARISVRMGVRCESSYLYVL